MKTWVIPLIGLGLITIGSLLPGDQIPISHWSEVSFMDKIVHFMAYCIIAIAFGWANKFHKLLTSNAHWWFLLVLLAVYSITIEILQGVFFEDRYFEVLDIIANIIGLLTGYLLTVKFLKNRTHAA